MRPKLTTNRTGAEDMTKRNRPSLGRSRAARGFDQFDTPPIALEPLFAHEPLLADVTRVCEPFCGLGNLVIAIRRRGLVVHASDIVNRGCPDSTVLDFFEMTERPPGCDVLLSNSPFAEAMRIIEHALALGFRIIVLLLKANFTSTAERYERLHKLGQEPLRIAGRDLTEAAAKGCHPPVALERKQDAAPAIVGRLGEGDDAFPLGRGVVGDGKDACFRDMLPWLNAGHINLPRHDRLIAQIAGLERRVSRAGRDSIDHAPGAHDDIANAVAGVVATFATANSYDSSLDWVTGPVSMHGMLGKRRAYGITFEGIGNSV